MSDEIDHAALVFEFVNKAKRLADLDEQIKRLKNFSPEYHKSCVSISFDRVGLQLPGESTVLGLVEIGRQRQIEALTSQLTELLEEAHMIKRKPTELPAQDLCR